MRAAAALALAVIAALAAAELVMQPAMGTRLQLALFFAGSAAAVAAAAWWLRRRAARISRLSRTIVALAAGALLAVGAAVTAASGLMFLSSHDLQLLWIVLGFALVLALVFAASVADPLTGDLRNIAAAARRVGSGDLTARTGVERPDEVGTVAAALDEMAARLASVEQEREREHEARRAFFAAVGHDLRTPLAALRAAVEALRDGVAADPDRYLRSMEKDVEALATLAEDLFVLARLESGNLDLELVPVDVAELADESIEALRPVASRRDVRLTLETQGHVRALGGPEALGRVIRNLVDNAIRHSPPGGEVIVRVEGNGAALVRVIDEGPGFPADFLERAFQSFSRSDEARTRDAGGAGLGLAIAEGFVRAHGGSIWADPGPGGRVAFRVPVPAID